MRRRILNNLTTAESLIHTKVKLTARNGGISISTGTAFFYNVVVSDDRVSTFLVTNKHVIQDCDRVIANCHLAKGDNIHSPSGEFIRVEIDIGESLVVPHPDPNVDIVAILITPIVNRCFNAGKPLFLSTTDASVIPSEKDWADFDAIEELVMIGCPNGLFDEANNLPIVRRGITATSLSKKYNGQDQFFIDMACFPGSSGVTRVFA